MVRSAPRPCSTTASLCFQPEVCGINPVIGLSVLSQSFAPRVRLLRHRSPAQTLEGLKLASRRFTQTRTALEKSPFFNVGAKTHSLCRCFLILVMFPLSCSDRRTSEETTGTYQPALTERSLCVLLASAKQHNTIKTNASCSFYYKETQNNSKRHQTI